MKSRYESVNNKRRRAQRQAEAARISEVAQQATQLQRQGMRRTEALRIVERLIPYY